MKNKYIKDLSFDNEKIIHKDKDYYLNEHPFGVLTNDINSPLYSVSVSNSSLSIDIWSGCAYGCKYCHVQGIYSYIKDEGQMKKKPVLNTKHSIDDIISELVEHPFFEKDITIISIGTGSTEPFGNIEVTQSTIDIMNSFVKRGYKNPFWIVTKAGIPKKIIGDLEEIANNGNKIMISICWANNPQNIEPVKNKRFKNVDLLKNIKNVYVAWYMRPLVAEWGANEKTLEYMFKYVYENYGDSIDMIVPGGMRWTSGIEYALTQINKVVLPNLIKDDNKKTLDDKIMSTIKNLSSKFFPNIPVFFNSSCALSYMLEKSSISLVNNIKEKNCHFSECPLKQRNICNCVSNIKEFKELEDKLSDIGIDIKFKKIDFKNNEIVSVPSISEFNYSIKQIIIRIIAEYKNKMRG